MKAGRQEGKDGTCRNIMVTVAELLLSALTLQGQRLQWPLPSLQALEISGCYREKAHTGQGHKSKSTSPRQWF
jgi:hypothetical protein